MLVGPPAVLTKAALQVWVGAGTIDDTATESHGATPRRFFELRTRQPVHDRNPLAAADGHPVPAVYSISTLDSSYKFPLYARHSDILPGSVAEPKPLLVDAPACRSR